MRKAMVFVLLIVFALVVYVAAYGRHHIHTVVVGDYGRGTPLQGEVDACDRSGGELIYYPDADTWSCE